MWSEPFAVSSLSNSDDWEKASAAPPGADADRDSARPVSCSSVGEAEPASDAGATLAVTVRSPDVAVGLIDINDSFGS
jgi:hypothetical protein